MTALDDFIRERSRDFTTAAAALAWCVLGAALWSLAGLGRPAGASEETKL